MRKIPAIIITGFLGAGKSTVVRHLMEHNHGRRIALIVNEFGDVASTVTCWRYGASRCGPATARSSW